MRNLIKQILNCENVAEKCFDLEILRRNWKLILFDTSAENLSLVSYNKKFGRYEICGKER